MCFYTMSDAAGMFPQQVNLAGPPIILPRLVAMRCVPAQLLGGWRGRPGVSGGAVRVLSQSELFRNERF